MHRSDDHHHPVTFDQQHLGHQNAASTSTSCMRGNSVDPMQSCCLRDRSSPGMAQLHLKQHPWNWMPTSASLMSKAVNDLTRRLLNNAELLSGLPAHHEMWNWHQALAKRAPKIQKTLSCSLSIQTSQEGLLQCSNTCKNQILAWGLSGHGPCAALEGIWPIWPAHA